MVAKPRHAEDEPDYLKELLAQAGIDAQASSVAAKLQEVVIGELHHRMKNTLGDCLGNYVSKSQVSE